MEEIKTRAEFFKELPLQKRLQAIEATRREGYARLTSMMPSSVRRYDALGGAFTWADTKQGGTYWYVLHIKYFED